MDNAYQNVEQVPENTFSSAYNFVPFGSRIRERYEKPEDLPGHDCWDRNLLSGKIRVKITAETPIFVGGSEEKEFLRDCNGQYIIPGSTLRGLLRENMQILGFGAVKEDEDFKNLSYAYRAIANAGDSVKGKLKKDYTQVLDIKDKIGPQNVKAGYLCCDRRDEYYILPPAAVTGAKKSFFEVKITEAIAQPWANEYAFEEEVWYAVNGSEVSHLQKEEGKGLHKGSLMRPGRMKGQNRLYLLPEIDTKQKPIQVNESSALNYKEDYELRKNQLPGTNRINRMNPTFWALPEPGEKKAVFYIERGEQLDMSRSRYMRVSFRHDVKEGLNNAQKEIQDRLVLDYAHAIFGFAGKEQSYRSRVSVGDCCADSGAKPNPEVTLTLGEPKPTFFAGYLTGAPKQEGISEVYSYNDEGFKLRGYKQYWFKSPRSVQTFKEKTASTFCPLPEGTVFRGTIGYRNLAEDELGLLLWCLVLEKDCRQAIGKAKPYGYGRVKVEVEELVEYSPETLYQSLEAAFPPADAARIDNLICAYKNSASEWRRQEEERESGKRKKARPIEKDKSIESFLWMKNQIFGPEDKTVDYMELTQFGKLKVPMKEVKQLKEEAKDKTGNPSQK